MKRLILTLLWCAVVCGLEAVPAKRITMNVEQPDGTTITLIQKGDEHFHYWETEDGLVALHREQGFYYAHIVDGKVVPSLQLVHAPEMRCEEEQRWVRTLPTRTEMYETRLMHDEGARRVSGRARSKVSVSTVGTVNVPVLLVQYADKKFASSTVKEDFEEHLNGDTYNRENGGYGSAKKYFEDQSGGLFSPQLDIIGPVTLSKNMEYYGGNDDQGNDLRPQEMVQEACRLANAEADFARYDNNGDGYVDILYVIYAGYGEASNPSQLENTIWPHQWQLQSPLSLDMVKINEYACNNELEYANEVRLAGIGTFCHEFSHCLGLPDFYDTGDKGGFGMNAWSLMDYGCYNNNGHTPCGYTGYEKDFLGWRKLVVLDNPTDVTMKPLSEGGDAYKIVNEANPNEYYVLENHKRTRWDSHAPAEGMLVIHVDYQEAAWQNNTTNNDPAHQRMTIIPADNTLTANTLRGDTYPGTSNNTELTDRSTPPAKVYTGGTMGQDITNISLDEGVISFSFMKGALSAPQNTAITDVTSSGFTLGWDMVDDATAYEVLLEYLELNPYLIDEDFTKVKRGNLDIGPSLDSYTNDKGWIGQAVYGLDEAIRLGSLSTVGAIWSPYFTCDSSSVTIAIGFKKSEKSDAGAQMLLGIGDRDWDNSLIGGLLIAENDEWETCIAVIDSVGENPFFYIDSRGDATEGLTTRADIDFICILPGDRADELLSDTENSQVPGILAEKMERRTHTVRLSCAQPYEPMPSQQRAMEEDSRYESSNGKRYYKHFVHSAHTTESNYRFEHLDSGRYACAVRSISGEVCSRYTLREEIELTGSDLPRLEVTPHIYIDKDSLYMQVEDSVTLYYTTDGTRPTAYSTRYDAPLPLRGKMSVLVVAHREGYRSTLPIEKANWFKQGDATYRIISDVTPEVAFTEAVGGNTQTDYAGHWVADGCVEHDAISYAIVGIDSAAFSQSTALRSVKLGKSLRFVGEGLFHGCTALNAVEWDTALPIASEQFDESSYYNLLIYVPEGCEFAHPLLTVGRMALIKGDKTGTLYFHEAKSFYCPRPFTAEYVRYERSFTQRSGLEDTAGWETIVLPFDVQDFTHSGKGKIAPFGVEARHHFWLSESTSNGFSPTTKLRANTPYIIAMPNNSAYGSNTINGIVAFSATQTTIFATNDLAEAEGDGYSFVPTYESVAPSENCYALNVYSTYGSYKPGSIFVPNEYTTAPFSAYIVPSAAQKAMPFYRIQKEPDEEDIETTFSVRAQGGVVYISLPEARTIDVYDMTGRKVYSAACEAGKTEITHLHDGIYIIENIKVYIVR